MNENDYNNDADTNDDELCKKISLNIHLNSLNIHLNSLNIHLSSLNIQKIKTEYQYLRETQNFFVNEDFVVDYYYQRSCLF